MRSRKFVAVVGFLAILPLPAWSAVQDPEARTHVRLKAMDGNGDSTVTLAEFTEYRRVWSSKRDDAAVQMRPEVVKRAFDNIDSDRDGSISFSELLVNTKAIQARQ